MLIADINAAGEAHPPVTDDDLAVSAEVDVVGPQPAQAEGVEPGGFTAGGPQRLQKPLIDSIGANRVEQQPDLYAGFGFGDELVAQSGSDPILSLIHI